MTGTPAAFARLIHLVEQIQEFVGHRLPGDIVIDAPKLAADGALPCPDGSIFFSIRFLFFCH